MRSLGSASSAQTRRPWLAVLLVVCVIGSACSSSGSGREGEVRVFAASSLTDAFATMAAEFEATQPGVEVQLVFGGSSTLREQILDGAEADVFASANVTVMADLVDAGAVVDAPAVFAANSLVIAVADGNPGGVTSLDDMARDDLAVGVCAQAVPCGAAARALLEAAGVEPSLDTEEPNVRALVAKVAAGELDVGLVYRSDVQAGDLETIEVPFDLAVDLDYSIGVIGRGVGNVDEVRDNAASAQADAFVAFVRSPAGQQVLEDHGFVARGGR